jgi:hypothetical protein
VTLVLAKLTPAPRAMAAERDVEYDRLDHHDILEKTANDNRMV